MPWPTVELEDPLGHVVEEVPVVRHGDDRALVARQVLLEPLHALGVEMVRRLVEQQDRRVSAGAAGPAPPAGARRRKACPRSGRAAGSAARPSPSRPAAPRPTRRASSIFSWSSPWRARIALLRRLVVGGGEFVPRRIVRRGELGERSGRPPRRRRGPSLPGVSCGSCSSRPTAISRLEMDAAVDLGVAPGQDPHAARTCPNRSGRARRSSRRRRTRARCRAGSPCARFFSTRRSSRR